MLPHILLLALGLVLLVKGADWLVAGAGQLARRVGMSELAIGLTVVAFGTSAPELVVNLVAAAGERSGLVYGNVVGSNLFNLFVILGLAGLLYPLGVQRSTVRLEIPLSLGAVALLYLFSAVLNGSDGLRLSRPEALVMLVFFGLFLWQVFRYLRAEPGATEAGEGAARVKYTWLAVLGGLVALVLGGRLVVTHAVYLAEVLGVPEDVVGLTILAAGTSLPELATSLIAAWRRSTDIAVGNVVGSNIFNILLVMPASALLRPVAYDPVFGRDMAWLAAGTLGLLLLLVLGRGHMLRRWHAALLLLAYVAYVSAIR